MESNKNVIYIGLGIFAVVVVVFWLLPAGILRPILYTLLALGSVFLIMLVLIQRGRGGGLAGALGGMGGYSAFGTRAGDVFTRITIVAAALWILGAMSLCRLNRKDARPFWDNPGAEVKRTLTQPTGIAPADSEKSDDTSAADDQTSSKESSSGKKGNEKADETAPEQ